jgi:hypothetical protein
MSEVEKVIIFQQYSGYSELFKEYGAQDDVPDGIEDEVPHPIAKFWQSATVAALAKTDKPVSVEFDMSVPASDIDDDASSPLYKSPAIVRGDGHRTLAKKLGIIRTERVTTADGAVWIHAFNCRDELVDARVLQSGD